MGDPLEKLEDEVQERGRESRLNGLLALFVAVEAALRYDKEKQEIKAQAEQATKDYDRMNVHDDQFDLAEACLSVAVALAGVTALTRRRWLFGLAGFFAAVGVIYGMAGFFKLSLHSDFMARLLG